VLTNPDNLAAIAAGGSGITAGGPFSRLRHLNIPNLSAWAIKASNTDAGGVAVRMIESLYVPHEVSI
jgi:hypothetical protein